MPSRLSREVCEDDAVKSAKVLIRYRGQQLPDYRRRIHRRFVVSVCFLDADLAVLGQSSSLLAGILDYHRFSFGLVRPISD
jgi:hypothetical protein